VATAADSKPASAASVKVLARDLEAVKEQADATERATGEIRELVTEIKDENESNQRAVLSLSGTVSSLTDHVRSIEDAVLRAGDDEPPEPRFHWLMVDDPEEAEKELADLVVWVGRVYLRFAGVELAPCWLWHETAVAELHVLYSGWQEARDAKTGTAFKLMDWHDRYRPSAVQRVTAELKSCSGSINEFAQHLSPNGPLVHRPPHVPGLDLGGHLADWWARTHGEDPAPQPTQEMVQAAKEAAAARHERSKRQY
jgi:hypothetical protein